MVKEPEEGYLDDKLSHVSRQSHYTGGIQARATNKCWSMSGVHPPFFFVAEQVWAAGAHLQQRKVKEGEKKNPRINTFLGRAILSDEPLTRIHRRGIARLLFLQAHSERRHPSVGGAPAVVHVAVVVRARRGEGRAPEEEAHEAETEHYEDGTCGAWRHRCRQGR
jgi:hypothetical protein